MDLELFKSAPLGAFFLYLAFGVSLVLAVFKWLHLYSGVRAENLKLSSQRTDRLYKMISDGSWRQASPLALQMAYVDAFGRELDDRFIRFAAGRHRPLPLLRDIRRCIGMVKVSADGSRLVRWRGFKFPRLSYRRHSQMAFLVGFLPYVGLMVGGGYFVRGVPHQTLGFVLGALLVWVPLAMTMANWFESAHRLIEALDEVYPAWTGGPDPGTFPAPEPMKPWGNTDHPGDSISVGTQGAA
ncbi:MAG TPA: hypothetical protein VGC19_06345 [Rhodanobacter sp.]